MKKSLSFMLALIMVLCMIPGVAMAAEVIDTWDGTIDTTWYNDTDTVFTLTTAEQLAGLAELVDGGNTFEGKTIKLGMNIDLDDKLFEPIGSYRKDTAFKGTFDGQGHTISNLSQNTWALDNGYYYGDLGMGLFGLVEDATIKNLVMDGAEISGESGLCGTIAAVSAGTCTFENITVKNANVADYQYYAGGIVGWASGEQTFINCDIDASTTIAAQWNEFNNANGGIIGGISTSGRYHMEDCDVACRIDAFNDVTSAYEWYSYRRSGMLVGDTGQKDDPDGDNVGNAIAPNLTCKNVTVTYGDWANYHYCEFTDMSYPWVRAEKGVSSDAYSNARYDHPTDANGNTVVDDNHVHKDGEKHRELIVFDQLYGGSTGDRYCTYGTATHPGVTVKYALIHSTNPEDNFMNGDIYMSDDDIFEAVLPDTERDGSQLVKVYLTVREIAENGIISGEKEAIEAKIGEGSIAFYVDIDLYKEVGNNPPEAVTNTENPITISLEIPEGELMEGYTYYVIRVHNSEAERIDGKLEGNKLTFASDKFSTYAVAYEETPVPAPAPKSSGSGISVTYNGGNSFSTSKSDVPTGVEIDNVPVSFTGNGNNFTVNGIPAGAKWITVRWNSTSVTTNFTPNGAYFAEVEIPKTGDVSLWAAIAQFFGF